MLFVEGRRQGCPTCEVGRVDEFVTYESLHAVEKTSCYHISPS